MKLFGTMQYLNRVIFEFACKDTKIKEMMSFNDKKT